MPTEYDIIGDIHGRACALEDVLAQLGYRPGPQGYAHPEGRKAIFLGDFIDRGPEQARGLSIVRAMIDAGNAQAIMGNHEFNAICYATPDGKGGYVREHSAENNHQHSRFLAEFPFGSPEHAEAIAWFRTLPVLIELEGFRVIHACWDDDSLDILRPYMDGHNCIRDEGYALYSRGAAEPVYKAIEIVLKAPEQDLPEGITYADPQGKIRSVARHLWWRDSGRPPHERLHIPVALAEDTIAALNAGARLRDVFMRAAVPTFVGHFGLPPDKGLELSSSVIVLDYSGRVTAYRRDSGERGFSPAGVVYSPQ